MWFDLYSGIVMPAHCDVYGHMNVRYYAACFDEAGWHFPRMVGLPLEALRSRGLGTVVASLTIDFLRELRAGQLIVVKGAITRVGAKSFNHEMRLFEADSMTHCATQRTVEVCFDTAARKAVEFPDDLREKLGSAVRAAPGKIG